jgi:hypothetical protein
LKKRFDGALKRKPGVAASTVEFDFDGALKIKPGAAVVGALKKKPLSKGAAQEWKDLPPDPPETSKGAVRESTREQA